MDVDARVLELVDLIRRDYVEKNQAMDFAKLAGYFTLDILTQIAFGQALGFLVKNEDLYDYHKSSSAFYPIMELGSNHPTVLAILNSRVMEGAAPKPTDKIGFGAIVGVAQKAVAERFGPHARKVQDMLGSFVNHGLTQQECEVESLLQILAGADSTATALRTTFLHILTSPPTYGKLREEIEAAIEAGNVDYPVVKHSQAQELPYLQACIKEGLRMFMPLHGLAGRVSPYPDGVTINGVFIPPGTEVGMATYAMGHRADFYGPDADTFHPERWTENDEETVKRFERHNELVFGTGRSSCLGKGIALMELGKAIFEVSDLHSSTFLKCVSTDSPTAPASLRFHCGQSVQRYEGAVELGGCPRRFPRKSVAEETTLIGHIQPHLGTLCSHIHFDTCLEVIRQYDSSSQLAFTVNRELNVLCKLGSELEAQVKGR
jgi:cytochrome P450